jgi:hypothetical protein
VTLLAACTAGAIVAAPMSTTRTSTLRHTTFMAATVKHGSATSSNWAGYAVTPITGSGVASFSNIFGTWVQPAAGCTSGTASYSAFWVGLGGLSGGSGALEQIGTDANCTSANTPVCAAWYELLPAPPVPLKLAVKPGDTISAAVTVSGQTVFMRLRNLTRGTVVNKKLRMATPDLSSAEWIAEAPSACNGSGRCSPLPLADFGSVDFLKAAATGAGHSGLIADPAWSATAISLDGSNAGSFARRAGSGTTASAVPTALTTSGSFTVNWQQNPPASLNG